MTSTPKKKTIKTVGVFCSSRLQENPIYAEHAEAMGRLLGQNGFDLVYGGGESGLMGIVAKAAIRHGSRVHGIITKAFKQAASYELIEGSTERVVTHLHTRKYGIIKKADAVICLFGGFGTLDEKYTTAAMNDMLITARSPEYLKPIIVINSGGFAEGEKQYIRTVIKEGGIYPGRERMIRSVDTPEEAIAKLKNWSAEGVMRGIDLASSVKEPEVHVLNVPRPY